MLPRFIQVYLWIAALVLGTGLIVVGHHVVGLKKRQPTSNYSNTSELNLLPSFLSK